jgi:hypothetical protein
LNLLAVDGRALQLETFRCISEKSNKLINVEAWPELQSSPAKVKKERIVVQDVAQPLDSFVLPASRPGILAD